MIIRFRRGGGGGGKKRTFLLAKEKLITQRTYVRTYVRAYIVRIIARTMKTDNSIIDPTGRGREREGG